MSISHSSLKRFSYGLLIGVAISSALVAAELLLHWPTSHYRSRLYFLLWGFPLTFFPYYFLPLAAASLTALFIAKWTSWAGAIGALVGTGLAVVGLYSGVFSYTVWIYEEDVTTLDKVGRLTIEIAVIVVTIVALRRAALRASAT